MSTITDLTGYTWVGNNTILDSSEIHEGGTYFFNLTFTSYAENFLYFGIEQQKYRFSAIYYSVSNTFQYHYVTVCTSDNGWVNNNYKTIQITGGTDATNADLIAWLETNGTLTQTPVGYDSTITLTNCTCNKSSETGLTGSYSATITANSEYYLSAVTCNHTGAVVTIAENKKTATIAIADVSSDFTISATGTAITVKNVILHPNNNGTTDYTTEILPKSIIDHTKQLPVLTSNPASDPQIPNGRIVICIVSSLPAAASQWDNIMYVVISAN